MTGVLGDRDVSDFVGNTFLLGSDDNEYIFNSGF